MDEMWSTPITVERPWTWREKLASGLTGHVPARVYTERIAGMAADDARCDRLAAELKLARAAENKQT